MDFDPIAHRREQTRLRVARHRELKTLPQELQVEAPASRKKVRAKSGPKADRAPAKPRPFLGVDGEGGGNDAAGRQNYTLLRAGDAEIHRGGEHLTWQECCEFICDIPRDAIAVSFAFDYDATQILRTLPVSRLERLMDREGAGRGVAYCGPYYIDYMPRKYLSVGRIGEDGRTVRGSRRTIYDTFGLFECSFVRALESFDIGTKWERDDIRRMKAERREFAGLTREIRLYCKRECELLAALMEKFRGLCHAGDIRPDTWSGAGRLAAALHKREDTQRHHMTARQGDPLAWLTVVPEQARVMAADAYYGGRFETSIVGHYDKPVWSHDIRSAYPDAMRRLPCLRHAKWIADGYQTDNHGYPLDYLWVGPVRFEHPRHLSFCGVPMRSNDGRLSWPRKGNGVYWSVEIDAARRAGATVTCGKGWRVYPGCGCQPFSWIPELFSYRKKMEKDHSKAAGIPIKRGINALYGQLARRVGGPGPWSNPAHAGLITAMTRARLMDAASQGAGAVLYLATDGIIATERLPLPEGPGLGEWEIGSHPEGVFVVQPGLYWGQGARAIGTKRRGIPERPMMDAAPLFESRWRDFMAESRAAHLFAGGYGGPSLDWMDGKPSVDISIPNFVGIRLAMARGEPKSAGIWTDPERNPDRDSRRRVSFDWTAKRRFSHASEGCIRTLPWNGSPSVTSTPYRPVDGEGDSLVRSLQAEHETLLDAVDFGPPRFDGAGGQA